MALFPRTLWPERVSHPYRRLFFGLMAAPLIIGTFLTLAAFVLAGMSEETSGQVVRVTVDSGIALFLLVFSFALTFGVIGVAVLWMLEQGGIIAWLVAGLLAGAVAAVLFGLLIPDGVDRVILLIFSLCGAAFFLIVRLVAGIQDAN